MIQLNDNPKIEYLVGRPLVRVRPKVPFDEIHCGFLCDLSSLIKKDNRITKLYPDLATFSFWARKGNLNKLKEHCLDEKARLGLGLTFHVTPGNVPVNFIYSFVFSFLAGNANIVKVPSRDFEQVGLLCDWINELLEWDKYKVLNDSIVFVRYSPCSEITESFTKIADAKMIWGSDSTIEQLKGFDSKVRSRDLFFSDRFSICIIDADVLTGCDKEEVSKLAHNFYNDTFLMDQNACSSPSLIVWLGQKNEKAKQCFWDEVLYLVRRRYEIQSSIVVDKYTQLCVDATRMSVSNASIDERYVYRLRLSALSAEIKMYKGRAGYFYEFETEDLFEILPILNTSCQTVTYFGGRCQSLLRLILENGIQGVDRIVPIGKALDIGVEWDGYEVIKNLTRIISLQ